MRCPEHELQIANSQGTKDAQTLAETYVRLGRDAFQLALGRLVEERKLKTYERLILVERTRNLLVNNGIIIRS
jgi:hypothetical protein